MANNLPRLDPKVKRIINEQCDECDIHYSQGEEIWVMIGQFVKEIMKKGDYHKGSESFKSIYIKDLGVIYPDPKTIYSQKKKMERIAEWRLRQLKEQEERENNG